MEHHKRHSKKTSVWLIIGVVFLVILLIIWLTVADMAGDTDVAAFINPITQILLP